MPETMSDTLVKVEGVSKKFCRSLKKSLWYGMQDLGREITGLKHGGEGELRPDEFWAVNNLSFEIKRGECLGLIGRNGAGKTTLLRMLNGLIKPDRGRIEIRGRIGALIALGSGFNPILTGRENIYVSASVFGLTKKETDAKLDEIINFAEIGEFVDMPVKNYSSGMNVRLGFAVATSFSTDVLLIDEVLAVGDVKFRMKCYDRINATVDRGIAAVLVSHNAIDISRVCTSAMLLRRGERVTSGSPSDVLSSYQTDLLSDENQRVNNSISSAILGVKFGMPDANLGKIANIETGQNLKIICLINVRSPIKSARIVLHIKNDHGFIASLSSALTMPKLDLAAGETEVPVTLKNIRLIQGAYEISFCLYGESITDYYGTSTPGMVRITTNSYDTFGFGVCHIYFPEHEWQ